MAASPGWAADYVVNTEGDLAAAITSANASAEDDTITLGTNITLSSALPPITDGVTIDGSGFSLTGSGSDRIFFVDAVGESVTIENFSVITGGVASGGDGGDGLAGGGLGAGGAIYVNQGDVTVTDVTFADNSATGGTGGASESGANTGGGGGLGGDGGDGGTTQSGDIGGGGGGGGYSGAGGGGGGTSTYATGYGYTQTDAGAGGSAIDPGGSGAVSGAGAAGFDGGAGGDGAGYSDPGYTQYVYVPGYYSPGYCYYSFWGGSYCYSGYTYSGYTYSYYVPGAGDNLAGGGGGGGGTGGGTGGDALVSGMYFAEGGGGGGGGGLSGTGGSGIAGGSGGDGSYGGGGAGGGGDLASGGDGGIFGGGGGGIAGAGAGGFGGGGGGSVTGTGGDGGFGGGSGGSVYTTAGVGGAGAGSGSSGTNDPTAGGGGGAGLGGAVFVGDGGTLTIGGNVNFTGSSATGGAAGGSLATAGAGAGSDLFLLSGTTTNFTPGAGNTIALGGTIGDDSSWTLDGTVGGIGSGGGATIAISGGGTVELSGTSTIAGGFTLDGTALHVTDTGLISAPGVAVELIGAGALLDNDGTINGAWTAGASSDPADINATVLVSASGQIDNSGLIYAGGGSNVAAIRADADLTLINSGTISGGSSVPAAGGYGVLGTNGASTLTIDNQSGGTIDGGAGGVVTVGTIDLSNAGSISSANGTGVSAASGSVNNQAGGSIEGVTGLVFTGGGTFALTSAGTITGTGGTAIDVAGTGTIGLAAGSTTTGNIVTGGSGIVTATLGGTLDGSYLGGAAQDDLALLTSFSLTGALDGGDGDDTLTFGGAGSGTFDISESSDFEQVTVDVDGDWTFSGTDSSTADWTIAAGTAKVGTSGINAGADVDVLAAGSLELMGNLEVGSLAGEAGADVVLGANILTSGGNGASTQFAGTISGTGGLTKAGSGTLTLSGADSYTGPTSVEGGTLSLANGAAIADIGAVIIGSGATLDLQDSETIGSLAGVSGSLVTLNASTLTTGGNGDSTTFAGIISGSGGLTKDGAGTMTLSGANSFTGATTVNGGTLQLGASGVLSDVTDLSVNAGAALDLQAFDETVGTADIAGTLAGTGTLTASTYTLDGAIIDANLGGGSLENVGGTSVLNGTAGAGTVLVSGGTLQLGASDRLADAADVTIAGGAALDLQAFDETVGTADISGTLSGTGTLTAASYTLDGAIIDANLGAGSLENVGGTSVLNGTAGAGTVLVSGGTLELGADDRLADSASLTIAGGATFDLQAFDDTVGSASIAGTLSGTGTLTAATYSLDGAVIDANLGTGSLENVGGTSILNGTAGAGTILVSGGTLELGADDRLADSASLTIDSGATFDLQAFNDTVGSASITGTLNGTGTLTAATYSLDGAVIDANLGAGSLENAGGTSILNGTAGAGTVLVSGGTLQLGASDRLADAADVTIDGGAALDLQVFNETVGTADIAGTLSGTGTLTASTYTLDGAIIDANLGTGSLDNVGGTSVLNGAAGAGTVLVSGGTLELGADDRLADSASLTIDTGATFDLQAFDDTVGSASITGTLAGTGTLTAATYTLDGAIIDANLGAGSLENVSGTSVLNGTAGAGTVLVSGGTLQFGASDRLADGADLTIDSGATLDLQAFDDTVGSASIAGTLTGTGTLTAATYTLDGAIIDANLGTGSLENLSGTSVLNGTAAAGTVLVSGGTLQLGADDRLADSASLTIDTGATFDLQAFDDTVGSAGIAGTLAGTGTLTASSYALDGATINANLGAGALENVGGTSVLNGTAGASTVLVSGGTLQLGASDRLVDSAALTIDSGAALDLQVFNETVGTADISGTLAGTGTLTAATYTLDGATIEANLGTGSLENVGGTSLLNGTAAASTVLVSGGTLQLGAGDRLADSAGLTIGSGAALDLQGFNETVGTAEISGTLAGTGTLTAATYTLDGATVDANLGAGILNVEGGVSVLNGTSAATDVNLLSGTLRLGGDQRLLGTTDLSVSDGFTLDLQSYDQDVASAYIAGTLGGTGTLTAATYTLDGAIIDANLGAGILNVEGGVSVLNGTSAATEVNLLSGTLRLGGDQRLLGTTDLSVSDSFTLDLQSYDQDVASAYIAGVLDGTGTLTAPLYILDGATINANLGAGSLENIGGTSLLNGTAAAETVLVSGGTLELGADERLSDSADVAVSDGAVLDLASFDETVGAASIAGTLSGNGTLTAATYTLDGATIDANLGAGSLENIGGVSILNGAAAAESVLVSGGTLQLGADERLADTAAVTIDGGAALNLQAFDETVGSASIAGTLSGSGTLTAATYTLDGAIIDANLGAGSLENIGGISVLNGVADAQSILVSSGTLQLGADERLSDSVIVGVAGAATFDLAGNEETVGGLAGLGQVVLGASGDPGKLTIVTAEDAEFDGAITGSGDVVKAGTGQFTLGGESAFDGTMNVASGLLTVNGSLLADVVVDTGAMLGGNGIIGNLTVLGGLAPGNSIGRITVNGDLVFESGSVYTVEVNPLLESDRTDVSGTITISPDAHVEVLAEAGDYQPSSTYRILTADGGVTGEFASVETDLAFLVPDLVYSPQAVDLRLVRNDVDFAQYAATPNQVSAAGAVQELGAGNALFDSVVKLSGSDAPGAFTQLSGEAYASVLSGITHSSLQIRDKMLEPPVEGEGLQLWADAVGTWGRIKGREGIAKSKSMDRYLIGGIDFRTHGFRIGVAGGLQGGDFDSRQLKSTSDLDSRFFGVTGGIRRGLFEMKAGAEWTWHDVSTRRAIAFGELNEIENGSFSGDTQQLFADASVEVSNGPAHIQPFARLARVITKVDSFNEAGGYAALMVDGGRQSVRLGTLGVRLSGDVASFGGTLSPKVELGWQHGWGELNSYSTARFAAGHGFLFQGAQLAKDAADIEAGVQWTNGRFNMGVSYTGFLSRYWVEHGVAVKLGIGF